MTISSETRKNGPYTGNGVTTAFPFTFKVFTKADVLVVSTDLTPADRTCVLDTEYTVALNADQDASPGGTITMLTAPPAGYLITLGGQLPETQSVVLTNMGGFYPEVVSAALDYLTILIQQLNEKLSRSLSLPFSTGEGVSAELPPVSPGSLIGWKADGTGLTNAGGTGVAPGGIVASNMAAGATGTAFAVDTAAATAKATPIDADTVGYVDSVTGNLVRATWTNIKAFLKTYFDTLYLAAASAFTKAESDARYAEGMLPFTAATAAAALTGTLGACLNKFRNPDLTIGTPVSTATSASLSLTIPATSNLGAPVSGQVNRLYWVEYYNGGTPVLGVINSTGSAQLDERQLVSPTTIGAASNSANVFYSASAVGANTPYRIIGSTDVVFTTGTGWSAPSIVQPAGGVALAELASFGFGQSDTDVAASRTLATTYFNTKNKPMWVQVDGSASSGSAFLSLTSNGVQKNGNQTMSVAGQRASVGGWVLPGKSYSISINAGSLAGMVWSEIS